MEIISVGQHAEGIFAFGQFATGVVAVGQVATGVIAIGQVARGVVCVGQLSVSLVWGIGMLSVSPGTAIGMLSLGGRGRGMLGISILPKPRQLIPGVDLVPALRLLMGGEQQGWVSLRLDRDGMGRMIAFEGKMPVPLEFIDPAARDRANELLLRGKRDVLVRVGIGTRQGEGEEGYRAAPTTQTVLQGMQIEPKPLPPPMTAGLIASWVVRLLILGGLAVGWWAVAGQPLAEALGIVES